MKFLLAQPSNLRFQWELEVVLTNLQEMGDHTVVLLFNDENPSIVEYIGHKYPFTECHMYPGIDDQGYAPAIKPYLWWKYLDEDESRQVGEYFYMDADVIFRELPDFSKLGATPDRWVGSDCIGYIGYDYIASRTHGENIIQEFEKILGVDSGVVKNTTGAGAQWMIVDPKAVYWYKVWKDSLRLHKYLQSTESNIQVWTAEMWAQLYNTSFFGIEVGIHSELDFCRPTDDIKMWDIVKILHNAGVMGEDGNYFFKGKYVNHTPFNEDLSWVRKDKTSAKYVEAINRVVVN